VLVNSHDPRHLRQEFDRDHRGTYSWDYLETGPTAWRIQITKRTAAELPRILGDTRAMTGGAEPGNTPGAVWKLQISHRQLDANVIYLEPHGQIETHSGPDLDVLVHVLDGAGQLTTETDSATLRTGALVWLPRRSQRSITAGPTGLSYLTVHPRRPALSIDTATASITSA
jgi:quercetin dioxygenase-like cupin family protein